jgi:hypothetical protein
MRLFAYLDAGTGSLFVQAIFGVVLAIIVVLRNSFSKILTKVRLVFSRSPATDEKK